MLSPGVVVNWRDLERQRVQLAALGLGPPVYRVSWPQPCAHMHHDAPSVNYQHKPLQSQRLHQTIRPWRLRP